MTKADLVEVVAKKASLTAKASREAVGAVFGAIADALKKGDKVVVTGFGTFMVRNRKSRTGRNPQTGASINIPARKTPGFTAGKALKKVVIDSEFRHEKAIESRKFAEAHYDPQKNAKEFANLLLRL